MLSATRGQRAVVSILVLLTLSLGSIPAFGQTQIRDDWEFYAMGGHDSLWKNRVFQFYLANQIHRLPDNNLLVWTEAVDSKTIHSHVDNQILSRVHEKEKLHKLPAYYRIGNLPASALVGLMVAEEVADEDLVPAETKILVQLDCTNQRYRIMSGAGVMGGHSVNLNSPLNWDFIAPDTQLSTLTALVCPTDKH